MDELITDLLRAPRASVVAAAGCGKTELIARAIAADPVGRHLVLTHTHAGVHALRDRLRRFDVPSHRATVSTIAAFALRLAAAFPATSGLATTAPTGDDEWRAVQASASRPLQMPALAEVLRASYSSVLVDEYQDCTPTQHHLVCALAEILHVRVFGDPMQGIFDFGDGIVDWSRDVDAAFERLADLDTPHRWLRTNPELGQWLITARHALQSGAPLPDPGDVIAHGRAERQEQLRVCRRLARKENAQVVAVHGYDNQAHAFAKQLRGQYTSIEEMACRSLMEAAAALDAAQATQRPLVLLDFLAEGTSNTSRYLRPARQRYEQEQLATARSDSVHRPAVDALNAVAHTSEPEQMLYAIDTVLRLPDVRVHRRELISEMRRALRYKADNPETSLEDAAWRVRDITRRAGRRLPRLIVGRTFLVKGLEFDHVVVLDADVLTTPRQMYVAITRGARSLTLLGELRRHEPALS